MTLTMTVTFGAPELPDGFIPFTMEFTGSGLPAGRTLTLFTTFGQESAQPVGTSTNTPTVSSGGTLAWTEKSSARPEYAGQTWDFDATLYDNKQGIIGRGGVLGQATVTMVVP